jgi:hypothetical protein
MFRAEGKLLLAKLGTPLGLLLPRPCNQGRPGGGGGGGGGSPAAARPAFQAAPAEALCAVEDGATAARAGQRPRQRDP